MGFLIPVVVVAVTSIAVEKIAQAITGQNLSKTTIPIGPFFITVGEGKPQYGVGLNVPLTKSGNIGISFGVVAGSGRKPSWNIGVNFSKEVKAGSKLRFQVKPEWSWTGSEFDSGTPEVSASLKKFKSNEAFFKNEPTWQATAKWSRKKFSLSAGGSRGGVTLSRYKDGSISVNADVIFIKKKIGGKEVEVAAGIRFGKGKPIFKLSGGVDLNKQFKIQLSDQFNSEINNMAVNLTRYKMEAGKRKEIAQKGTIKYDFYSGAPTIQLEGKDLIPLSFKIEDNKLKNVLIDTQAITDYIAKKLLPYPEDISWQKRIGQLIEVPILKGVKAVSGEKIPDYVMQLILENFSQRPVQISLPNELQDFVEKYAFPKEPANLKNWQIDMLKQYSTLYGLPEAELFSKIKPLISRIKSPSESSLANALLKGQISLKDYLSGTTYSVKNLEEKYYETFKENNQLTTLEHIRSFLSGDPIEVGDAIKELLKKQPEGKEAVLKAYGAMPEAKQRSISYAWKNFAEGLKNAVTGIPTLLSMPVQLLSAAPDTEYETIIVGGQEVKIPITRNWQTPEGRKFMKDTAKGLVDAWFVDPFRQGKDIAKEAVKLSKDDPLISMLSGGLVPLSQSLWRGFADDPLRMMANAAIVSANLRMFSNQARFMGAITRPEAAGIAPAGLEYTGGFGARTLDIAEGLAKASELIDPMNAIFGSAKYGIASFLEDKFPSLAKSVKTRTQLNEIIAQREHARLMDTIISQKEATQSISKFLTSFADDEQQILRRAIATGDTTILPATWATQAFNLGKGKLANKMQTAYDIISESKTLEDIRRRLALESGFMNIDRMKDRIWADAEKTYGMTKSELLAKGFEPSYVPYLAAQPGASYLQDALKSVKPKFEKKFVGDIEKVEKLTLDRAISKHQADFINKAYDEMLIKDAISLGKSQGIALPWKLGQELKKGYVVWDPYNFLTKNDLNYEFTGKFLENLQKLGGNADDALRVAFSEYSDISKAAEKLSPLLKGEYPIFQVPKNFAWTVESSLYNPFKIPSLIERPTAWAKTMYLAGRMGWVVNDFKDNALRVLMQSGFSTFKGNALAERWRPIIPDEIGFHGIGYELMSQAIEPAGKGTAWKKFIYSNEKLNKFVGKIDAEVDKMWRKNLFATELEREVKRGLLKDYAANFAWNWNELDKIAVSTLDDWAKSPAKYGKEISAAQNKVMKVIENTLYDGSKVLPFLTKNEKSIFKSVFLFPEFMIDTFRKSMTLAARYPYQMKALGNLTDMYNAYLVDENEKPPWLSGSKELAENIWLRPTAGTMFDPEWGLLSPNATMNPLMQAAIEYISGKDLRSFDPAHPFAPLEPLSDPSQLYYFNPLTQKMQIIPRAETIEEVNKNIEGYEKGILALLNEISTLKLSGPEIQDRLKRIDQAQRMIGQVWKPQKEMLEAGISAEPTTPSFAELFLRKLPQYKLLEDALQPYTKYDTSTLLEPKVILDKRTGEPKHDINVWLQVLRLLGASVSEFDLDKWQEKQATLKKVQQSVTFSQLINRMVKDDPDLLAKLREDIIQGKIPLNWRELPWHEEIEQRFGIGNFNLPPMKLPTEYDLQTTIDAINYAKQADIQAINDQAALAKENLKFFNPDILPKLRDSIDALAAQKKSEVEYYYDQVKQTESMMRVFDDIKTAADLKDRLTTMSTPITAEEIVKEMIREIKDAGGKIKIKTADLTNAVSEFLTNKIQNNQEISLKNLGKELAEVLGFSTKEMTTAILNSLNKFVKIPASLTLAKQQAEWAKNRLDELAFIELKKKLTGTWPDTKFVAPDLQQILAEDIFNYYLGPVPDTMKEIDLLTEDDLEKAVVQIETDAQEAIRRIQESGISFGNLVIKAVDKKKKETIKRVRSTYKKTVRMKALFTKERIANSRQALENAVKQRQEFLESMSFGHWSDIFNPSKITSSSGPLPVEGLLNALAGAKAEILKLFGSGPLNEFLTTEEGRQYTQLEDDVLASLDYYAPQYPWLNDYASAYRSFQRSPSLELFNSLRSYLKRDLEKSEGVPMLYRGTGGDLYTKLYPRSSWKNEESYDIKMQELDRYSRVYVTEEYKAVEQATIKSYKTLTKKLVEGEKRGAWFVGVLLQK